MKALPALVAIIVSLFMAISTFAKSPPSHTGATPPVTNPSKDSDVVSAAEKSGTPPIPVPPVTARIWTLQNGLTVIVQEDHSAPVASVQAWCQTGSIDEDKHLGAGLSHILEHMLFKGTETRTTNQFAQRIQDQGGYINAYTSFDRTVFWIDIPAKGVGTAVDLLSDAMMNSTLPPEEYTKEQEVIRREFAMGYDDPDRMAGLLSFETAYQEHPYRLPVIGHMEIYNKLTRDEVMEYYKARYVPNNLFFVVVGDVDAEKVHQQIETYFAKYPQKSLPPHYIPQEPPQLGRREIHKEFPTELTRLDLVWHTPQITHPDVPALDLLSTILGDGRSSRLYQKLREEKGLVHSISAFCYTPGDPGVWGVGAVLDPNKREATQAAVLDLMREVKEQGVSTAELEKAKRKTLSDHINSLTTMRGKASDLGSNWMQTRNLNFSNDYLAAIQRVTAEDIKRVLNTYFEDKNLTITSLNPTGSLKNEQEKVTPISAGEIQKFELPNGLRLLVREDPRLPLVSMVATFKAGLLVETPENNGLTRLASRVMIKGTKTRTGEQIASQIESAGGSISTDAGNNSFSVAVKVMQPDTTLGLEILSDVLLNATFPEKELDREKEAQLAGIKAEEEEMTTVARNLMRSTLFGNHPYGLRNLGTPESVGKLSQQQLADFYKKYAVGKNGVLAVYGSVKANEVKSLVERLFGSMPAGETALANIQKPQPLAQSSTVEEHKPKAQAVLMVGYLGADMFSPDRAALELIDEASSDLGSRFFIRIREKMGLAYYVGAQQMLGLVPGPFVFYLGTSPAKVEAVKAELLDEISKLAREGLTVEELARAKEKLIGQQDIRNQSEDAFAYMTALDELYGLGFNYYKDLKSKVEAVTLEDIKRVANKYFENKPEVIAIVRPEPKPDAQPSPTPAAAAKVE
jgi:zinc protease